MPSIDCLDSRPPPGAWDSHVHIVDEDVWPLHPDHPYRPQKASLSDLQTFHRAHGISHPCIVAFSVYQTDSKPIVDSLRRLEGIGRAVASIDPRTISDAELQRLHDAGVRGIRINVRTSSEALDIPALKSAADRVRPYGWVIQLYVALAQMVELATVIPELHITIVIDHIGAPDARAGPIMAQKGYKEFMDLLINGHIWTKLSGTYRFLSLPGLDEYVIDILRCAPDKVVWASDWPHSGGVEANPDGDRTRTQPYRKIDDAAWIRKCQEYCHLASNGSGRDLAQKIWVDNPRKLWQYDAKDS